MNKIKLLLSLFLTVIFSSSSMAQSEFSSNLIGVGVVTTDLEKSMSFYLNVIGMRKSGAFNINAEFARSSGLSNGVPFHVEVLKLEDTPDANVWKLMSFGNDSTHSRSTYIQDDIGMQYITIRVNSLEPFLKRIKDQNVKLLGDTPTALGEDNHFVLVQAPEGTLIELIGPLN